ncbi:hypothetical protein HDU83_003976 [Entophlyctis luteolus]|nr:hypothetical protein HDU83_003976 [Entophlyctis luteolus]
MADRHPSIYDRNRQNRERDYQQRLLQQQQQVLSPPRVAGTLLPSSPTSPYFANDYALADNGRSDMRQVPVPLPAAPRIPARHSVHNTPRQLHPDNPRSAPGGSRSFSADDHPATAPFPLPMPMPIPIASNSASDQQEQHISYGQYSEWNPQQQQQQNSQEETETPLRANVRFAHSSSSSTMSVSPPAYVDASSPQTQAPPALSSGTPPITLQHDLFRAANKDLAAQRYEQALGGYEQFLSQLKQQYGGARREDWYAAAMCLSNMAVANRRLSRLTEALHCARRAWDTACVAVAKEKRRLMMLGIGETDGWMDAVISQLQLDWAYITGDDVNDSRDKGKNPKMDGSGSGWQSPDDDYNDLYGDLHSSEEEEQSSKLIHGPPIAVLFLDLTTNYGNVFLDLGDIENAFKKHFECFCLADYILEYVSLEPVFRVELPLPVESRFATAMLGKVAPRATGWSKPAKGTAPSQKRGILQDRGVPDPGPFRRIHLSYVHRACILAQTRSLTHLGACCHLLALDDTAMQCNSQAHVIADFYARYAVVGGLTQMQVQEANAASASAGASGLMRRRDTTKSAESSMSIANTNMDSNGKRKIGRREEQWLAQVEQANKTQLFMKSSMYPLKAAVCANLATSFYTKGKLSAAVELLLESSKMFQSLNRSTDYYRSMTSLYALRIELGRTVKGIHWIRNMTENDTDVIDECTRYWGPPRLRDINNQDSRDSTAEEFFGAKWVTSALVGLRECLSYQEVHDRVGKFVTLLNLASGQLVNGQPYAALFYLTQLLEDDLPISYIPEWLKVHAHFTLCQAMFLLLRINDSNYYPKYVFWDDGSFTFYNEGEKIPKLMEALVQRPVHEFEAFNLELHCQSYLSAVQTLDNIRKEIEIPYIGLNVKINIAEDHHGGGGNSGGGTTNADGSSGGTTGSHVYGLEVGMDFYTQQMFLVRMMLGKAHWTDAPRAGMNFEQHARGLNEFESAVEDALSRLRVPGPKDRFVDSLAVCVARASSVPSSTGPSDGGDGDSSSNIVLAPTTRDSAALLYSAFVAPVLFGVGADVMADAAYLRNPNNQYQISTEIIDRLFVHKALAVQRHVAMLAAARTLLRCTLDMCDDCLKLLQDAMDRNSAELVFVSKDGRLLRAEDDGSSVKRQASEDDDAAAAAPSSGANLAELRSSLTAKLDCAEHVHMFPCKHFYVSEG